MKTIFGNYDPVDMSATWPHQLLADCGVGDYGAKPLLARPRLFQRVQEDNGAKAYLLTEASPDDPHWGAHPEAPLVSVAVFSWNGSGWHVEAENMSLGCIGTFGGLAPFSFVQWAENRHGILFSAGFTNMGVTESSTLLFGPVGSTVAEIASIAVTGYDDCLDEQTSCRKKESTVKFSPSPGSPYYELRVETQETIGTAEPRLTEQTFRFNGRAYTLDSPGDSR